MAKYQGATLDNGPGLHISITWSRAAGWAGPSGHSAGGRRDGDTATVFPGTSHQTFCFSLENSKLMASILSLVS